MIKEFEPVITFAFDAGRSITNWLDSLVSGTYWGQIAVNHLRERVNMTYVVLSIPAIVIATILVGIPLNWFLGGTRSALQRIAIALVSVPATVVLAVTLFTFNALVPETYAALLRFADWIWQASLSALSSRGDSIPGATKLVNIARQGFSGHHYVIMALCSVVASFLVNAAFAFATKPRDPECLCAEIRCLCSGDSFLERSEDATLSGWAEKTRHAPPSLSDRRYWRLIIA